MSTLTNPRSTATYDAKDDRVVIAFRDGRDASVIELDADNLPALLRALTEAQRTVKLARKPAPLPPPMTRPATCPAPRPPAALDASALPADRRPIRLVGGIRR